MTTATRHARIPALAACLLLALAASALAQPPATGWLVVPAPGDSFSFNIFKGDTQVIATKLHGWTPAFKDNVGFSVRNATIEGDAFVSSGNPKAAGDSFGCAQSVTKSGDKAVTWVYTLTAEKDIPLTMFATFWTVSGAPAGDMELTMADGSTKAMPFRMGKTSVGKPVAKAIYRFTDLGNVTLGFEPPVDFGFDNQLRIQLAGAKLAAGTRTVKVTATFDSPVRFVFKPEDRAALNTMPQGPDWFPLQDVVDMGPSVIGMENWLPKPAGAKGQVKIVKDRLEFADGTPAKFWGTNLCYETTNPPAAEADFTAARFAKYGINTVRFHKFLERGIGDKDTWTKFAPVPPPNPNARGADAAAKPTSGIERMDYFASALAKNGVYYTFSPFFGFQVKPGDKDRLLAYDEVVAGLDRNRGAYGLVNIAPDIQDLVAAMYTNLLTHVNPNTGKSYAQDPALLAVEIQNEDDIFATIKSLYPGEKPTKFPTYCKALHERFSDFLKAKYGSQDKLAAAWGASFDPAKESFDARNIAIKPDQWFMGLDGLAQAGDNAGLVARLMDNAAFLHDEQNKFYGKLVKVIRATGYQGVIIGSPWHATSMVPHYYNLKSDAMVGLVDRHNYFNGTFASMMAKPGSGYLGTGLQQVSDKPFSVSEWIHVWPAMHAVEGPAIMAVYGMGLQDWDASWEFQSETRLGNAGGRQGAPLALRNLTGGREGDGFDVWNVDTPANAGQFPALARMIYRGDVKTGDPISVRQISDQNLATGKFDFSDKMALSGARDDVKELTSTVPAAALVAGRVVVEFTGDKPAKSVMPDMTKYEKDGVIKSATGQLAWDTTGQGFFTVNTAGTKAAVGFHTGKPLVCDKVTITPAAQYASIFLTALEPDKTLENCKGALITALARQCNSGFSYFLDRSTVSNGKGPTVLEPVKATFAIAGRKVAAVNALNHEGKRVEGQTVKVDGGSFTIDTARDKTFYYEVVFAE